MEKKPERYDGWIDTSRDMMVRLDSVSFGDIVTLAEQLITVTGPKVMHIMICRREEEERDAD